MSNENFENKTYPDWDNVILQVNLGDESVANIRMQRQDMEAIQSLHGSERTEVIEMMLQALEEQVSNRTVDTED